MMKLRIRAASGGATLRIEVPQQCSLQRAREVIAQTLASQGITFSLPIHLSLNKALKIQGPDSSLLTEYGIRSGDLLFYSHGPNCSFGFSADAQSAGFAEGSRVDHEHNMDVTPELSLQNTAKTRQELCAEAAIRRAVVPQASADAASSLNQPSLSTIHEQEVKNKTVSEVMSIETTQSSELSGSGTGFLDATMTEGCGSDVPYQDAAPFDTSTSQADTSIPAILQRVLLAEQRNVHYPDELLLLAIHAVMLETGFRLFNSSMEGNNLPHGWSHGRTTNLQYTLPDIGQSEEGGHAVLKSHTIRNTLVVYGSILIGSPTSKYRLCMQTTAYLVGGTLSGDLLESFSDLFGLWKFVKDGLSLPLLTALCEQAGLPLPSSLSILPIELKMKVLEFLPALDLVNMGCTCSEFRHLSANDELWKKQFYVEFGHSVGQQPPGFCGWKGAFQQKFMERRRSLARAVRSRPFFYGIPRLPHRRPQRYGGIIGGNSDLFPPMGGGPFGGRRGDTRGFLGDLHERLRIDRGGMAGMY